MRHLSSFFNSTAQYAFLRSSIAFATRRDAEHKRQDRMGRGIRKLSLRQKPYPKLMLMPIGNDIGMRH
jgi:hypothetical protein